MQSVIAFACLLAVASAGYIHSPYISPAVAYGAIYNEGAYRGEGLYEGAYKGEGLIESQDDARAAVVAPVGLASQARLVDPVAVAAGAPLPTGDTVEVAHAKAAHFAAHAAAKGNFIAAPVATYAAHTYGAPVYAARSYVAPTVALASEARQVDPVAIAAGAPLPTGDTVEVAAAKAAHFAAHAVAKSNVYGTPVFAAHAYGAPIHHAYAAVASEARQVDPVAIAAGAPLPTGDTYEVAAAKAAHFRAHAAAKGHIIAKRGLLATTYAAPIAHSYGYSTYAAPLAYGYGYNYGRYGFY